MSAFTKGKWGVCNDEKVYVLLDDDSAVYIAGIHGDNASELQANVILIASAREIYESLKAIRNGVRALTVSNLDGLYEVASNA